MNSITIPQFFKDFTGDINKFRELLSNLERGTADPKYGETLEEQQAFLQELHRSFVGIHPNKRKNSTASEDLGEWFYYNGVYYHIGGSGGGGGEEGTQGSQGAQGIQGVQGIQGLQGIQGVQGSQGVQGVQGLQGPAGSGSEVDTKNTAGNREINNRIYLVGVLNKSEDGDEEDYEQSHTHTRFEGDDPDDPNFLHGAEYAGNTYIDETGWLRSGDHRVLVEGDLQELYDRLEELENPDKWPNPSKIKPDFSQPALNTSCASAPAPTGKFKFRFADTQITNGSVYDITNGDEIILAASISVNTQSNLLCNNLPVDDYNSQSTQTIQNRIINMNVDNANPATGYKRTLDGATIHDDTIIGDAVSLTPVAIEHRKDKTAETIFKLLINETTYSINNGNGAGSLIFETITPVSFKHGVNTIQTKFINPSWIEITGGSRTVPGITPVYYCSKKGRVSASKTVGIEQRISSISNNQTSPMTEKSSSIITFYGAYPIYCNSAYNGGQGLKTSPYTVSEVQNMVGNTSGHFYGSYSPGNISHITNYSFDKSKYLWNYNTGVSLTFYIILGNIESSNKPDTGARIYLPDNSITGYNLRVTSVYGLDVMSGNYNQPSWQANVVELNSEIKNGHRYRVFGIYAPSGSSWGQNAFMVTIQR